MARIDASDEKVLRAGVDKYLAEFPGDLICALQMWYEGLGGQGVPNPAEMAAMNAALAVTAGWQDAGDVRYEKFGVQKSFKRVKTAFRAPKPLLEGAYERG